MKASKLLADVNLDIRIERGLKILEFATQYNLRKAYYRHCPLNSLGERDGLPKNKAMQYQEHTQTADIIMELNEQINNWSASSPQKSPRKSQKQQKVGKNKATPEPSKVQSDLSNYSLHAISNLSKEEEDPSQHRLDDLSDYASSATKMKLKSISQEQEDSNSASKIESLKNSALKPKSSKSEIIRVDDRDDISVKSKKSNRQKVQTVKQPSKQSSKFTKKDKIVEVISPNALNHSHQSHKQKSTPNKIQNDSNLSSKNPSSSHHSFLDKSYSRIVSNSSQLPSKQQGNTSSISDFQLLRELSASFQDQENMRMLLKLENCELEESYLERRIVNRLEKGYKEANTIKDITWESLKLPKMEYGFVRPNYAHLIE